MKRVLSFLFVPSLMLCATSAYGSPPECIDYADLTSEDVVCTRGDFLDAFEFAGVVDSGPQSDKSFHTVHTAVGEKDPNVPALSTIPPGFASAVRVGGYLPGGSASITYTMSVPEGADMSLIVRYAIVHEYPMHAAGENQQFKLQILDGNGAVIDSACAMVEYTAGDNTQSWNKEYGEGYREFIWNDWEAVGFNLWPYAGDTIKLRVVSRPCYSGGHASYAYFVTECVENRMEGIGCGVEATRFEAPGGFSYLWYRSDDDAKGKLGDKPVFDVPRGGAEEYSVDVISRKDPDCHFTITASPGAHYPKAAATWELTSGRCENEVTFHNDSYMYTVEGGDTVRREALTECTWDFGEYGRYTGSDPVVVFPQEGDTVEAVLTAMRGGDEGCSDVLRMTVQVPRTGNDTARVYAAVCNGAPVHMSGSLPGWCKPDWKTGTDTFRTDKGHGCKEVLILTVEDAEAVTVDSTAVICAGSATDFYGRPITEEGVYEHVLKYSEGCDSVVVRLTVDVMEVSFAELEEASICEGDEYDFRGRVLREEGVYHDTVRSAAGCDSVIYSLELHVKELDISVAGVVEACVDSGYVRIAFEAKGADVTECSMAFDGDGIAVHMCEVGDGEVTIRLPDTVRPDVYPATLRLVWGECGEKVFPVAVAVQYPADIVRQKWNNVLAVCNERYNGGYRFATFRWYKDGVEMPGEYEPILYIPYGQLDTAAYYQVEMLREGDGALLKCCPIKPVHKDESRFAVAPTLVSRGGAVRAVSSGRGVARLYDVSGVCVAMFEILPGENRLEMPQGCGVFVLAVELEDGYRRSEKIVLI